ncbi:hypothetical protein L9F63_009583, partial [Diploptera punctata]
YIFLADIYIFRVYFFVVVVYLGYDIFILNICRGFNESEIVFFLCGNISSNGKNRTGIMTIIIYFVYRYNRLPCDINGQGMRQIIPIYAGN